MSSSLGSHELHWARLSCSSLSPRVYSNSRPLSRWCHLTVSSSAFLFSSYPQSFPPSGLFPVSWLVSSGGQSIGASTSVSVLPRNIQGWFPLILTGWISLLFKRFSRVFSSTTVWRHQFFGTNIFRAFPKFCFIVFFFFFCCSVLGLQDLSSPAGDGTCAPLEWKCWILTTGPPGKSL